jgi:hypothetical protein
MDSMGLEAKDVIKKRLLKQAGRQWDFSKEPENGEPVDFDPLVDLLFGAFASEMERIAHRVETVESRVVQRVFELIVPETANKPTPAYSVINLVPKFSEGQVEPILNRFSHYSSKLRKEFFFSPAGSFKVIDSAVSTICFGLKAYQLITPTNKIPKPVNWGYGGGFDPGICWVGLRLSTDITSLDGVSLFFEWANLKQKEELLKNSQYIKISHNDQIIPFTRGIKDLTETTSDKHSFLRDHELSVQRELQNHFITFELSDVMPELTRSNFPPEWHQVLSDDQLTLFSEPLVWLKLVFPPVITTQLFEQMVIQTNCFPVLNVRLRPDTTKNHPLRAFFNAFPLLLEPDEYFYEVINVINSNSIRLEPADQSEGSGNHTYVVRTGGVARFDKRNSLESLHNLLNLIRDEAHSFMAIGSDDYNETVKELKSLHEPLVKIANRLKESKQIEGLPYIVVNTADASYVTCQYWTTTGGEANAIPSNERLEAIQQGNLFDSVQFVQPVRGGRQKLPPESQLSLVKKLLLSRNQIVTHADLKAEILSSWGAQVKNVTISKQISQTSGQNRGLKPELLITLYYQKSSKHTNALLEEIERSVRRVIEDKSAIPINSLFTVTIRWKEMES